MGALEDCIRRGAKGLLKEVSLFDIYTGAGIPEGKKSVAFNLTLRADDRNLTAQEADEDVKSILETAESRAERRFALIRSDGHQSFQAILCKHRGDFCF